MSMASEEPSGKWKENVYMHKIKKCCSAIQNLFGNAYTDLANGFGLPEKCPYHPVNKLY